MKGKVISNAQKEHLQNHTCFVDGIHHGADERFDGIRMHEHVFRQGYHRKRIDLYRKIRGLFLDLIQEVLHSTSGGYS